MSLVVHFIGCNQRYLIRFLVHLNEIFDVSVTHLESIQTVEQIERLTKTLYFSEFNQMTNRFYSASFSAFNRYIKTVVEVKVEEQIDSDINNYLQQGIVKIEENNLVKSPTKRKSKQNIKGIYTFPRSELEMMKAKMNRNWECEINSSHITFINEQLNKPFVEGHHLIPMFAQNQFEYTIDFSDNIVTLCPNCHRKIHYGLQEDKYEMIQLLFEKVNDVLHLTMCSEKKNSCFFPPHKPAFHRSLLKRSHAINPTFHPFQVHF